MDIITINLNLLKKLGLNINEYLTLYTIYLSAKQRIDIPFKIDKQYKVSLLIKRLLKQTKISGEYKLSKEGLDIFEGSDYFAIFYKIFPRTVPSDNGDRVVSTNDPLGISAAFTRKLWNKQTKGDETFQKQIIECLKFELSNRRSQDTIKYLHNIDTWLRRADWEKWKHLLNKEEDNNNFVTKL